MTDTCLKTAAIYGPCANAPEHSTGEPAHVVGTKLYCERCCVVCNPKEKP